MSMVVYNPISIPYPFPPLALDVWSKDMVLKSLLCIESLEELLNLSSPQAAPQDLWGWHPGINIFLNFKMKPRLSTTDL